ncbi:MAG: ion channel activity [Cirrosporium novae-zelandiae]|nr:MAG: ion channel activity [Cirrosporium novae-zelandiae]
MGNQALSINGFTNSGGTTNNHLTVEGSDWYWTVASVMGLATLIFLGLSFTKPRPNRLFHYITGSITLIAAIAYFTMASNLGWTPIHVEFTRSSHLVSGDYRQIFYVRYIDWFITTPLILLDILLTAALPWSTVLFVILMDWVMVICALIGALVKSTYKWGYFTFACAAFFIVAWHVVWVGRNHAKYLGSDVHKAYVICGFWTIFLWFLYPISWGVSEGGNVISSDGEAIFYGILDLLTKPVFGALLLWAHRGIDPARLGIHIRDYDEPIVRTAAATSEKHTNGAGLTNGQGNEATTGAATGSEAV